MIFRTLQQIRDERGENVHGFVLIVTGALPEDDIRSTELGREVFEAVEATLSKFHSKDVELGSLGMRVEDFETFIKEGLPGAS